MKSEIPNLQNPKSKIPRHLARIEVGSAELPKLLEGDLCFRVAEALKLIGYAHVTLDLQGYRRGGASGVAGAAALTATGPVR